MKSKRYGPMARPPRLMGRGRALESIEAERVRLENDTIDADTIILAAGIVRAPSRAQSLSYVISVAESPSTFHDAKPQPSSGVVTGRLCADSGPGRPSLPRAGSTDYGVHVDEANGRSSLKPYSEKIASESVYAHEC